MQFKRFSLWAAALVATGVLLSGQPVSASDEEPVTATASGLPKPYVSSAAPQSEQSQSQTSSTTSESGTQLWLWLGSLGLLAAGGLAILAWHPAGKALGWMQVQGLVLIRRAPGGPKHDDCAGTEHAFEQQYRQFASIYQPLGLKLDFSGDGMKLELGSSRALPVLRPGVPGRLCQELQTLLDTLPPDKYFLQIHLEGRITGVFRVQRFNLASHEGRVGLHLQESPRFSLKGVFFNG